MYHLCLSQGSLAQTLWHPAATSDSQATLEFHFYGFHWETSRVFQLHSHSHCCRPTYKADHIHSNTIPSLPLNSQSCSYSMSFPNMESCPTLHLIMVLSLSPISSNLLEKPLICTCISHWVIILKATGRLNEWTKLLNSISGSIAVINRIIGLHFFPLLNSLTTMPWMWPLASLPSLPIKDTTQTLLFILSKIFPLLMPENLPLTLISFTKNCTHRLQLHKNITKALQNPDILPCKGTLRLRRSLRLEAGIQSI